MPSGSSVVGAEIEGGGEDEGEVVGGSVTDGDDAGAPAQAATSTTTKDAAGTMARVFILT